MPRKPKARPTYDGQHTPWEKGIYWEGSQAFIRDDGVHILDAVEEWGMYSTHDWGMDAYSTKYTLSKEEKMDYIRDICYTTNRWLSDIMLESM